MVAPYILKMEYIDWFDMCQLFFKNFTGGIMSWNWFGTINYNNNKKLSQNNLLAQPRRWSLVLSPRHT